MKLLGSTDSKITTDKNGENVPHLEIVELVLVHCNLVNNDYQQDSRISHAFAPNKPFGSLLKISPTNHIFLKTYNSEFEEIKVCFTDQTSKPLEEDKINVNNNNPSTNPFLFPVELLLFSTRAFSKLHFFFFSL